MQFKNRQPQIPNPVKKCDHSTCQITSEEVVRLVCGHTYHTVCLDSGPCPHCTDPLLQKINELADAFNTSLLTPTCSSSRPSNSSTDNPDDDVQEDITINERQPDYYDSNEWQLHVDSQLSSFTVAQPSNSSTSQPLSQSTVPQVHHHSGPVSQSSTAVTITTLRNAAGNFFLFPFTMSQSTLNGRMGSNACTFIAIYLAKLYHGQSSQLGQPVQMSPLWVALMLSSILNGNKVHDDLTQGQPVNFSVEDAVANLQQRIGPIHLEDSLDLTFINENPNVPQSSVAFFLQRLSREAKLSAVVIINGMSITLVGHGAEIVLLDSHLHRPNGALIASSKWDKTEQFLGEVKASISPHINMCTLTYVRF